MEQAALDYFSGLSGRRTVGDSFLATTDGQRSYTLSKDPIPGSGSFYLNGLLQESAAFVLTGVSLEINLDIPVLIGDKILIQYHHIGG